MLTDSIAETSAGWQESMRVLLRDTEDLSLEAFHVVGWAVEWVVAVVDWVAEIPEDYANGETSGMAYGLSAYLL